MMSAPSVCVLSCKQNLGEVSIGGSEESQERWSALLQKGFHYFQAFCMNTIVHSFSQQQFVTMTQ
jgi:hypothetical protein